MVKLEYWGDLSTTDDLIRFIKTFSNCKSIKIMKRNQFPRDAVDEDGDSLVETYFDMDDCAVLVNNLKKHYFAVFDGSDTLIMEDLFKIVLESEESEESEESKEEPVKNDRRLNLLF
jgi:hypothetical protein